MSNIVESYFNNDIFTIQASTFSSDENLFHKEKKPNVSILLIQPEKYQTTKESQECLICLETLQQKEVIYTCTFCSKAFHFTCMNKMISSFIHRKCPICRTVLPIIRR